MATNTVLTLKRAIVALGLLLVPIAAHAQGTLTGVVKDTSGAVLPGVTVEAASPVLIEKTRSVVTDSSGGGRVRVPRPPPDPRSLRGPRCSPPQHRGPAAPA